ncbi:MULTISPECIES: hypothetical protein [Bacillus amyloliquefaciens group]|uniref:hypothetical protein n=1 Tax=Bacillus amyloliquefaciens group TaxID=1938374 RepID=UPI0003960723|nr:MULTISPECIES: hypothetical protein [Bacillus amyloliquefaciens group]ERH55279.1 hypothetical protein O205_21185 [Bacillus amyloliquefaciens EGD-AQ14]
MDSEQQSESLNDLLMLQKQVNRLIQKEDVLKRNFESAIETFLEKNSRCGSKAGREDYWTHVSCKDIWDLREAYRAYKGEK